MTPQEVAWVAGILEGEGTFVMRHNHVGIAMAMTDEDVVRRICEVTGVGTVAGPRMAQKSTKPYWIWTAHRRDQVVSLLSELRPWFGARRFERVADLIDRACDARDSRAEILARHGRRSKYERGCRCQPCRDAVQAYKRKLRLAKDGQ